jgi:hypothetical protein
MTARYRFDGKRDSLLNAIRSTMAQGSRLFAENESGASIRGRECPAQRKAILRTALGHGDAIADMVNKQCLTADPGKARQAMKFHAARVRRRRRYHPVIPGTMPPRTC